MSDRQEALLEQHVLDRNMLGNWQNITIMQLDNDHMAIPNKLR